MLCSWKDACKDVLVGFKNNKLYSYVSYLEYAIKVLLYSLVSLQALWYVEMLKMKMTCAIILVLCNVGW